MYYKKLKNTDRKTLGLLDCMTGRRWMLNGYPNLSDICESFNTIVQTNPHIFGQEP